MAMRVSAGSANENVSGASGHRADQRGLGGLRPALSPTSNGAAISKSANAKQIAGGQIHAGASPGEGRHAAPHGGGPQDTCSDSATYSRDLLEHERSVA